MIQRPQIATTRAPFILASRIASQPRPGTHRRGRAVANAAVLLCLGGCLAGAGSSLAQSPAPAASPGSATVAQPALDPGAQSRTVTEPVAATDSPKAERGWEATFSASGNYGFKSDLKDSPGQVAISHVDAKLDLSIPVGDRNSIGFTFTGELTAFSFEDATGFVPGFSKPWDDVWTNTISARYIYVANDNWSTFVGIGVSSSREAGADFSDSIEIAGFGVVNYRFSDNLTVGGGLLVASEIEDDMRFLPLLLVDWKFAEKWNLGTSSIGGRGLGLGVQYAPSDTWSFAIQGGYRSLNFRLDDNGAVPNGVGRNSAIAIQFRTDWKVQDQVKIGAYAGIYLGRELILDDPNGNRIFKTDVDPAPYLGASIDFTF